MCQVTHTEQGSRVWEPQGSVVTGQDCRPEAMADGDWEAASLGGVCSHIQGARRLFWIQEKNDLRIEKKRGRLWGRDPQVSLVQVRGAGHRSEAALASQLSPQLSEPRPVVAQVSACPSVLEPALERHSPRTSQTHIH